VFLCNSLAVLPSPNSAFCQFSSKTLLSIYSSPFNRRIANAERGTTHQHLKDGREQLRPDYNHYCDRCKRAIDRAIESCQVKASRANARMPLIRWETAAYRDPGEDEQTSRKAPERRLPEAAMSWLHRLLATEFSTRSRQDTTRSLPCSTPPTGSLSPPADRP
jgi:hypothetical protein